MHIEQGSAIDGKRIDEIDYSARVLARTARGEMTAQSPASPATMIHAGDVLAVYTAAAQLTMLSAAGHAEHVAPK